MIKKYLSEEERHKNYVPEEARTEIVYKDFILKRELPYNLWYIFEPSGIGPINGAYTKIELTKGAVDRIIENKDTKKK